MQLHVHRFGPAALIAIAALLTSGAKLAWAETTSRSVLGCAWCVSHAAVPHELQWLSLLACLHLASCGLMARARPLAVLLRLVVLGLLLLAVVDLFVLQQFLVRLTLGEAAKFIGEPQALSGFLAHLDGTSLALVAVGLLAAALTARAYLGHRDPPARRSLAALLFVATLGLVGSALAKVDDQHTPYLHNSVEAFFTRPSRLQPYSAAFSAKLQRDTGAERAQRCFDGLGQRPDVLLLMVESLSAYHSHRLSGLADWTPALDAVAAHGLALDGFHANGVNSEHGMIALLTGEPPIERGTAAGKTLYDGFLATADSVPRMMRRAGYSTHFISGFTLDFPGMHRWLQEVGFQRVEGNEAAFFAGRPHVRMHFDSVPDELLFERLLHELAQPRSGPRFITAFTQSTHHPYIDPSSGQRTQEAAFRYLDRSLGRFVDGLRAQRFFDNGLLVIVGDHRAMQPMGQDERRRFGDRGFARVPMVVLGSPLGAASAVSSAFSQTDLLPSLRHLVSREPVCLAPDQGIFLPTPRATPRCVYTLRAYNPDRVYAHCGADDAVVELDGDRTRLVAPSPHPVLDVIHRLRIGRGF